MSEAGDRAGRAGARHLHVVFLLQVDHLDPAQAADVGVLLVEVLGKVLVSAVKRSIGSITGFTITEKAPTRAFSCLKAPTSAFTFKQDTIKTLCLMGIDPMVRRREIGTPMQKSLGTGGLVSIVS